jgi:hypothetical protein
MSNIKKKNHQNNGSGSWYVNHLAFKSARKKAIAITNNLLFVLVRLLGDLYYDVQIKNA